MIHEHFSIDIGYNDDKDCIEWSEITLSGRPIAECSDEDRELLQRGLEHYGIAFMLREFGAAEIRQIYEKGITPEELYSNLKNNNPVNPWHKVSEELPKEGEVCLVIFKPKEGGCMLLMLSFQEGYFNDFRAIEGKYIYWMPIPELPKEE